MVFHTVMKPLICIWVMLISVLFVPINSQVKSDSDLLSIGDTAPQFILKKLDGEVFNLRNNRNKVVVLAFFTTWCNPCKIEMPKLQSEVWEKFNKDEFEMLCIGRCHNRKEVTKFLKNIGVKYPAAADPDRQIYSLYADKSIPRVFVIGKDGTIVYQYAGSNKNNITRLINEIEKALGSV